MMSPEEANAINYMVSIGFSHEEAYNALKEQARQADLQNAYNYTALIKQAETAEATARISAGASRANALANASAARYAADQSLKATQLDTAAKLKIAAMDIAQRSRETEAQLAAQPGKWVEAAYYKRGAQPPGAATTPGPTVTTQRNPWQQFQQGQQQPSAIVGERGPEMARMTPQGMRINPLSRRQAWQYQQQGVPAMAEGGVLTPVGTVATTQPTSWQRFQQFQANRQGMGGRGFGGRNWGQIGQANTQGTTPAATQPYNTQPWLEMMRSGQRPPAFQGWKFPETGAPQLGITSVPPPTQVRYDYFLQLDPDEQQQALALWRSVYNLTPEAAMAYMQRASFAGTAPTMTGWG
jgi:hypothetical protein